MTIRQFVRDNIYSVEDYKDMIALYRGTYPKENMSKARMNTIRQYFYQVKSELIANQNIIAREMWDDDIIEHAEDVRIFSRNLTYAFIIGGGILLTVTLWIIS